MKTEQIVATLLESDEVDPKEMAAQQPSAVEQAQQQATEIFMQRVGEGSINSARDADEQASEIAQDACDTFSLDDEFFDEIVSDLFLKASELFPGDW